MARDYYDALGVARNASAEEIQQAFRTLARRYHPDISKDPASEERFKEINEAYQVLSDPDTRQRYDRYGPDFRRIPEGYEEAATAGTRSGATTGGAGFGGFGGFGGGRAGGVYVGDDVDFEDLFSGLFGGRARTAGPVAGADQEAELELTVEEAYHGGKRHLTLSGPDGERGYDVTIPRGVIDGQRIRLAGQGGRGHRGPSGDLYLRVRITPHPRYRLHGRDLYLDLPITPWEAVLGATIPTTTPGGETKIRVEPGTTTGTRLRLRGEGMPNPRGRPGDLYAETKIMTPTRPTPRERQLFEQLAQESTYDPRK